MNHAARRDRLRALLPDVDGLLVLDLANIRYLSGFAGSNAVLFIGADGDDDLIATDGRYAEQITVECPDLPVLIDRGTLALMVQQLAGHGMLSIALESGATWEQLDAVRTSIAHVQPCTGLVEELRSVKDEHELTLLAEAGRITAQAIDGLCSEIGAGWTEIAVARRLEQRFGELGAPDRAFATIVASGPNSALPHHRPGERVLAPGDLVVIDAGAEVGGYHADATRTVVVGDPAPWQEELHALVALAAAQARAAAVPGADLRELDAVARSVIADAGHAEHFVHGLGHGVGLQIHEAPMIGPRAVGRLSSSTPITIEPGVYLPGRGGVRVEDTLVVGLGVLTESDRSLRRV